MTSGVKRYLLVFARNSVQSTTPSGYNLELATCFAWRGGGHPNARKQVHAGGHRDGPAAAESETHVVGLCRKMQVAETTFYRWKKKFGGMETPEVRELGQLREETRKLKQLVVDPSIKQTATTYGRTAV